MHANAWVVLALYQFKSFLAFEGAQASMLDFCKRNGIKGTLLIAAEGINGTVAGSRSAIDALKERLVSGYWGVSFDAMSLKESYSEKTPFLRMKVKLKKEIVTLGQPEADPSAQVGVYVSGRDWNALISDPATLVIDTRNDYEYQVGTFKGAINPNTQSFRDFPEFVEKHLNPKMHQRLAMFCTGGIRCEKGTAYMLAKGFSEVYHLDGGILRYLEEVPESESLWQGECFVFDDRVTVKSNLTPGTYGMCHGCRRPITEADKSHPDYRRGISCHHCAHEKSDTQKQKYAERQKQIDLAVKRKEVHLGVDQRLVSLS